VRAQSLAERSLQDRAGGHVGWKDTITGLPSSVPARRIEICAFAAIFDLRLTKSAARLLPELAPFSPVQATHHGSLQGK